MNETLVNFGDAIKALGTSADGSTGRIGGYLVRWGSPDETDLVGDWFTEKTYLGANEGNGADVMIHHGLPLTDGKGHAVKGLEWTTDVFLPPLKTHRDKIGLFAETVCDLSDEFEKKVYELASAGKFKWSSGAAAHTVRRKGNQKTGEIVRWPIAEGSLTPRPCEPRGTGVMSLKALSDWMELSGSDTAAATPENLTDELKWDESQHPRDKDGKFGSGGGGGRERLRARGLDPEAEIELLTGREPASVPPQAIDLIADISDAREGKISKDYAAQKREEARRLVADAANGSLTGKERADALENARLVSDLAQSLQDTVTRASRKPQPSANATTEKNPPARPTTYYKGDRAEYTGKTEETAGQIFHEVEVMEGHRKGQKFLTPIAPKGNDPRAARFQQEWNEQQSEFRRLRKSIDIDDEPETSTINFLDYLPALKSGYVGLRLSDHPTLALAAVEGLLTRLKEYDSLKAGRVMSADTHGSLTDCHARLESAVGDLKELLSKHDPQQYAESYDADADAEKSLTLDAEIEALEIRFLELVTP